MPDISVVSPGSIGSLDVLSDADYFIAVNSETGILGRVPVPVGKQQRIHVYDTAPVQAPLSNVLSSAAVLAGQFGADSPTNNGTITDNDVLNLASGNAFTNGNAASFEIAQMPASGKRWVLWQPGNGAWSGNDAAALWMADGAGIGIYVMYCPARNDIAPFPQGLSFGIADGGNPVVTPITASPGANFWVLLEIDADTNQVTVRADGFTDTAAYPAALAGYKITTDILATVADTNYDVLMSSDPAKLPAGVTPTAGFSNFTAPAGGAQPQRVTWDGVTIPLSDSFNRAMVSGNQITSVQNGYRQASVAVNPNVNSQYLSVTVDGLIPGNNHAFYISYGRNPVIEDGEGNDIAMVALAPDGSIRGGGTIGGAASVDLLIPGEDIDVTAGVELCVQINRQQKTMHLVTADGVMDLGSFADYTGEEKFWITGLFLGYSEVEGDPDDIRNVVLSVDTTTAVEENFPVSSGSYPAGLSTEVPALPAEALVGDMVVNSQDYTTAEGVYVETGTIGTVLTIEPPAVSYHRGEGGVEMRNVQSEIARLVTDSVTRRKSGVKSSKMMYELHTNTRAKLTAIANSANVNGSLNVYRHWPRISNLPADEVNDGWVVATLDNMDLSHYERELQILFDKDQTNTTKYRDFIVPFGSLMFQGNYDRYVDILPEGAQADTLNTLLRISAKDGIIGYSGGSPTILEGIASTDSNNRFGLGFRLQVDGTGVNVPWVRLISSRLDNDTYLAERDIGTYVGGGTNYLSFIKNLQIRIGVGPNESGNTDLRHASFDMDNFHNLGTPFMRTATDGGYLIIYNGNYDDEVNPYRKFFTNATGSQYTTMLASSLGVGEWGTTPVGFSYNGIDVEVGDVFIILPSAYGYGPYGPDITGIRGKNFLDLFVIKRNPTGMNFADLYDPEFAAIPGPVNNLKRYLAREADKMRKLREQHTITLSAGETVVNLSDYPPVRKYFIEVGDSASFSNGGVLTIQTDAGSGGVLNWPHKVQVLGDGTGAANYANIGDVEYGEVSAPVYETSAYCEIVHDADITGTPEGHLRWFSAPAVLGDDTGDAFVAATGADFYHETGTGTDYTLTLPTHPRKEGDVSWYGDFVIFFSDAWTNSLTVNDPRSRAIGGVVLPTTVAAGDKLRFRFSGSDAGTVIFMGVE